MKLGNNIFLWEEDLMYRLDMETGENKYGVDYDLFYIDPWSTIAVGYPPGYYSKLEGIDLQNGITLWHREISNEYGWNDAFFSQ